MNEENICCIVNDVTISQIMNLNIVAFQNHTSTSILAEVIILNSIRFLYFILYSPTQCVVQSQCQ